jgi:hypothetical protein
MCDPQLADYLTDLLTTFVHMDDFYPFRDAAGQRLEDLAAMLTEAQFQEPLSRLDRERIIHRHIGDFALFWTGLFPEGVRKLQRVGTGDRLGDYLQQGKRSYAIASELTDADDQPPAGVLRRLSERFEFCMYGLHLCRKEWVTLAERRPSTD